MHHLAVFFVQTLGNRAFLMKLSRGGAVSRSLAVVGILTIVGVAGTWSAVGQDETGQTSQGVVVKNHMSDNERDRLMQEAMEKARLELEKKKAQEQAEQEARAAAEKKKAEAAAARDAAAEAAGSKREAANAAAEQKAREEKLAKDLAEAERKASEKVKESVTESASTSKDLDTLAPLKDEPVKKTETTAKASEDGKSESKSAKKTASVTVEDKASEAEKRTEKPEKSEKKTASVAREESATEPEKAVIKTVSTKEPGSGISVKTSMPVGDAEREAQQRAAAAGRAGTGNEDRNGREMTLTGQVVGMMRSDGGPPRILVNSEDRRMVQVVLESDRSEVPAAGSHVSIRGREISGGGSRMVLSAISVTIKSGQALPRVEEQMPEVAAAPPPMGMMPPPPPVIMGGPPPPLIGGIGLPGPLLPGMPGGMMPPPPPC